MDASGAAAWAYRVGRCTARRATVLCLGGRDRGGQHPGAVPGVLPPHHRRHHGRSPVLIYCPIEGGARIAAGPVGEALPASRAQEDLAVSARPWLLHFLN